MKNVSVPTQPLQSVIVTVYAPTPNPEISSVVAPFDHENVYKAAFGSP